MTEVAGESSRMAEIVVEKSEWTVKFAGSHSCAGLGESRGKKLGVAPRSSDLSSWWQNVGEGHGCTAKAGLQI